MFTRLLRYLTDPKYCVTFVSKDPVFISVVKVRNGTSFEEALKKSGYHTTVYSVKIGDTYLFNYQFPTFHVFSNFVAYIQMPITGG